jgi:hypothetical protein
MVDNLAAEREAVTAFLHTIVDEVSPQEHAARWSSKISMLVVHTAMPTCYKGFLHTI